VFAQTPPRQQQLTLQQPLLLDLAGSTAPELELWHFPSYARPRLSLLRAAQLCRLRWLRSAIPTVDVALLMTFESRQVAVESHFSGPQQSFHELAAMLGKLQCRRLCRDDAASTDHGMLS
jgi:hypothetical protein